MPTQGHFVGPLVRRLEAAGHPVPADLMAVAATVRLRPATPVYNSVVVGEHATLFSRNLTTGVDVSLFF